MKKKRAAIYARVSTRDQTIASQLADLRKAADYHDWIVAEEFMENLRAGRFAPIAYA